MNLKIDRDDAKNKLLKAFAAASEVDYSPQSSFCEEIGRVIKGPHKTYRYVLITGLLAKAVNNSANPLVLQAGSSLPGAYDARSLCHYVFVPFEREYMANALGGSNEPFLNKPARFTELSKSNAVRRGNDKQTLDLLCDFLPRIKSADEANLCLSDAIYFSLQRFGSLKQLLARKQVKAAETIDIYLFLKEYVSESVEGETLALAVGALMEYMSACMLKNYEVKVHPVNQAGSSSREFSDIDVYWENRLTYAIEAKDKTFSSQDVQHALSKLGDSALNRLIFVVGPQGRLEGSSIEDECQKAANDGLFLSFFDFPTFCSSVLSLVPSSASGDIVSFMIKTAIENGFKDRSISRLNELSKNYSLV